jgi:hypothetical protein
MPAQQPTLDLVHGIGGRTLRLDGDPGVLDKNSPDTPGPGSKHLYHGVGMRRRFRREKRATPVMKGRIPGRPITNMQRLSDTHDRRASSNRADPQGVAAPPSQAAATQEFIFTARLRVDKLKILIALRQCHRKRKYRALPACIDIFYIPVHRYRRNQIDSKPACLAL